MAPERGAPAALPEPSEALPFGVDPETLNALEREVIGAVFLAVVEYGASVSKVSRDPEPWAPSPPAYVLTPGRLRHVIHQRMVPFQMADRSRARLLELLERVVCVNGVALRDLGARLRDGPPVPGLPPWLDVEPPPSAESFEPDPPES